MRNLSEIEMRGQKTPNGVAHKRFAFDKLKLRSVMRYFNLYTPLSFIASCIWNLSEITGITLGKYGITIFNLMMQQKGDRL